MAQKRRKKAKKAGLDLGWITVSFCIAAIVLSILLIITYMHMLE